MKKIFFLLFIICLISCKDQSSSKVLEKGYFRVILEVKNQQKLPFIMYVNSKNSLEILNAEEVVLVDEITYKSDSVYIQVPVF